VRAGIDPSRVLISQYPDPTHADNGIAATIARPKVGGAARPGIRFGLIEYALAPFLDTLRAVDPQPPNQLRHDLAIVIGAEALFCLTDLLGCVSTTTRPARRGQRQRSPLQHSPKPDERGSGP
jgi:hypothetical protein